MKKNIMQEIKDLGWEGLKISKSDFKGAVKVFKNKAGVNVAVMFGFTKAYVVKDAQGFFNAKDLMGLHAFEGVDIQSPEDIDGAIIIAAATIIDDTVTVDLDEAGITICNFDAEAIKADVTLRLDTLIELTSSSELKFG